MSGQLRLGGIRRIKKHNILVLIILAVVVRLFFSPPPFINFASNHNFSEKKWWGINIFLGDNALAKKPEDISNSQKFSSIDPLKNINPENLFEKSDVKASYNKSTFKKDKESNNKQEEIYDELVKGYPLSVMTFEIAKQDKSVAAFLIAIAKKESDWGKHSPKKNGVECYNYWGYRGGYNATESGYSCFDSPSQAIAVVGGRIENLIDQGINTPERMIVWKCGRDCSWDNPVAVKKWVSDVSAYYHKLNS